MGLIKDVCYGIKGDRTPIWIMRQAGRYLPEYKKVRENISMLGAIEDPQIAADITLMPIKRFDFDGAVIFADILNPLQGFGVTVEFNEKPILSGGPDIFTDKLTPFDPKEFISPTLEAIKLVRAKLPAEKDVIGFSGSPLTLCYYLLGCNIDKSYRKLYQLMMDYPFQWRELQGVLSKQVVALLLEQVKAGASVVQIFDSHAGSVPVDIYRTKVLPFVAGIIKELRSQNVPVIYFCPYGSSLYRLIGELDAVIGLDWHLSLDDVLQSRILRESHVIQGNLDPNLLHCNFDAVSPHIEEILIKGRRFRGHIFNLGHGILPDTRLETVEKLVRFVKEYRF